MSTFNLEDFFFNTPIYSEIKITEDSRAEFNSLLHFNSKRDIEGYNSFQKIDSTFSIEKQLSHYTHDLENKGGYGIVTIVCKRYGDEFLYACMWFPDKQTLIKVGQYPSIADIHIKKIKRYKKMLPPNKLTEFTRAIGLAANGVGIGSYVYLRRIFEYLINQAYEKAKKEGTVKDSDYMAVRVDEKIKLLKGYLPEFLVKNKSMYSILSLGIHELDEAKCLAHFPTLQIGIEIILDEQLEIKKREEKNNLAEKKIRDLKGKINQK